MPHDVTPEVVRVTLGHREAHRLKDWIIDNVPELPADAKQIVYGTALDIVQHDVHVGWVTVVRKPDGESTSITDSDIW